MRHNYVGATAIPLFGPALYGRQCVEYVDRFFYYGMDYKADDGTVTNASIWMGNGVDYYGSAATKRLNAYPNGGTTRPMPGDILCLGGGPSGLGHVAIVTAVSDTAVTVLQQNLASVSAFKMVRSRSACSVSVWSGFWCQSWLRSRRAPPPQR